MSLVLEALHLFTTGLIIRNTDFLTESEEKIEKKVSLNYIIKTKNYFIKLITDKLF